MLNDHFIQLLSERDGLITPYNRDNVQPHSYDCTLDDVIRVAYYDEKSDERYWDQYNCYTNEFFLKPGQFALASTKEYFRIPQDIVGFVQGKSTVGRNGLQIENAGLIDAGFSGAITLELYNMAPWPIKLKAGMRICQVHFTSVDAPVYKDYSKIGHYNGQRGATKAVYTL
jgi:dCTP deaminase